MKRIHLLGMATLLPIVVIGLVNVFNEIPTVELKENECTRYCHNVECPHFLAETKSQTVNPLLQDLYRQNIEWLRNNPFGISYVEMNIVTYMITLPVLILLLIWGLVRKDRLRC